MDFIKNNKLALGGVAAALLLGYVYFTYFAGSSAPLTVGTGGQDDVSGDLLVTLGSLHTIRLDNSIFTDPVFASLSDFGVAIPPQDAGRRNPFAPVGSAAQAAPAPTH